MVSSDGNEEGTLSLETLTRRAVVRAAGGAATLGIGAGSVSAAGGGGPTVEQVGIAGVKNVVDPVFGFAAMGPNPCRDGDGDCLQAFPQPIRPATAVDLHIGIPGLVFGVVESGGLSSETTATLNQAVADGSLEGDTLPQTSVNIGDDEVPIPAIGQALLETEGFHFDPAGLSVEPGDIVLFNAETPDHGVAVYHERHGRQNRVPDGVGPMTAPMIPAGGFWLAQFEKPGVYDLYCPPHQLFGMVMRIVVWDGSGDVPDHSVENTGRPPTGENLLSEVLAGLDPNVPSSAEALATDVLTPANIADAGEVSWHEVVEAHRTA